MTPTAVTITPEKSVNDITAGANASTNDYNNDNSYDTNQFSGGPGTCPVVTIPTLTTSASSAMAPNAIHDTATLTGTGGGTGSMTFKLYPSGANCAGTALYTNTVSTNGDGDYQSGDYSPTSPGSNQWQASYSSSSVSGLITPCNDPNETSPVTPPGQHAKPGIKVVKLSSVPCSALPGSDISPKPGQPSGVLPCSRVCQPVHAGHDHDRGSQGRELFDSDQLPDSRDQYRQVAVDAQPE